MITKNYILRSSNSGAEIQLKYSTEGGYLVGFELLNDIEPKFLPKLITGVPTTVGILSQWHKFKAITIDELPPDLSFEVFWKQYNLKEKKINAEKRWKNLTEANKIKALNYIKKYRAECQHKGIAMQNPDTYLNQMRWLDKE